MSHIDYLVSNGLVAEDTQHELSTDPARIAEANRLYDKLRSQQQKSWERYSRKKADEQAEAMRAAQHAWLD